MYFLREAITFCCHYFENGVPTRNKKFPQNHDGGYKHPDDDNVTLSSFSYTGHHYGKTKTRFFSNEEFNFAHSYILLNEDMIKPYIR